MSFVLQNYDIEFLVYFVKRNVLMLQHKLIQFRIELNVICCVVYRPNENTIFRKQENKTNI